MIRIPSTEERIHTACSLHTGTSLSQEQGEALTHAMTWRDLEDTLHNGRTRHKAPQCDSIDRNHPEQVNPETGSGLVRAKGLVSLQRETEDAVAFVRCNVLE
jgi:hypothetical protein